MDYISLAMLDLDPRPCKTLLQVMAIYGRGCGHESVELWETLFSLNLRYRNDVILLIRIYKHIRKILLKLIKGMYVPECNGLDHIDKT